VDPISAYRLNTHLQGIGPWCDFAHHRWGVNCRQTSSTRKAGTQLQLALELGEAGSALGFGAKYELSGDALLRKFASKLSINIELTRSLVSFQANKAMPFYRWFKYREAFSAEFVEYILERFKPIDPTRRPRMLDPFAGSGTALLIAANHGFEATGIEILPIGTFILKARKAAYRVDPAILKRELNRFKRHSPDSDADHFFSHLKITQGAFSKRTEEELSIFMGFLASIRDSDVLDLFRFACLAVLEDISFTRKDGQYLRWDRRSGKKLKSNFNKGEVTEFREAIVSKLDLIMQDIRNGSGSTDARYVGMREGSCLEELPHLADNSVDIVLTSPPYCNRYDYTRTYALELAFLGLGDDAIKRLRQRLLSCTVENRSKEQEMEAYYSALGEPNRFKSAVSAFSRQESLAEVLDFLNKTRDRGELNNSNIPTLVKNYFFEMNLVIRELARIVAPGGKIVMVNDNVQYHGQEIPVDLILGDFAERAGLSVNCIWVLPRGKGNSSQQMGAFGRKEIRKCVYVWEKSSPQKQIRRCRTT
jgi:DNA modification methylase